CGTCRACCRASSRRRNYAIARARSPAASTRSDRSGDRSWFRNALVRAGRSSEAPPGFVRCGSHSKRKRPAREGLRKICADLNQSKKPAALSARQLFIENEEIYALFAPRRRTPSFDVRGESGIEEGRVAP